MTADAAGRGRLFLALTFLWSWLFWGLAVLSGRPWTEPPTAYFYAAGGVGPTLVAILLVHLDRAGKTPAAFWRRILDFRRISPAWYAVILAVGLLPSMIASLIPTGPASAGSGSPSGFTGTILIVAVVAALAEEPGWRGYALDRLMMVRSPLAAGLVVGLAWTAWHLPFYFIAGTIQQEAGVGSLDFWSDMITRLPLAVLFTWIYVNTGRSILAAVLLHAVDNLASVVVGPEGRQVLVRLALTTAGATLVVLLGGRELSTGGRDRA